MLEVALRVNLEQSTVALAYVYLDRLLLRKFCHSKSSLRLAGVASLILASKFNDPRAIDRAVYKKLLVAIKQTFGIDSKEAHTAEFKAWAALEFQLFLPVR